MSQTAIALRTQEKCGSLAAKTQLSQKDHPFAALVKLPF
jgi:hypothetical protein